MTEKKPLPEIPESRKKQGERRVCNRLRISRNWRAEIEGVESAEIRDINVNGACLVTSQPLAADSVYRIKILSPGQEEISISGLALWSFVAGIEARKDTIYPFYKTGIKYIEIEEDVRIFLEKLINDVTG